MAVKYKVIGKGDIRTDLLNKLYNDEGWEVKCAVEDLLIMERNAVYIRKNNDGSVKALERSK